MRVLPCASTLLCTTARRCCGRTRCWCGTHLHQGPPPVPSFSSVQGSPVLAACWQSAVVGRSCFNRFCLAKVWLNSNVDGSNLTLKAENKIFFKTSHYNTLTFFFFSPTCNQHKTYVFLKSSSLRFDKMATSGMLIYFFGTTKTSDFSEASLGIGWREQFSVEYDNELNFITGVLHPWVQVLCVFCSPLRLRGRLREGEVSAGDGDEDGGRRGQLSTGK